VFFEGPHSCQKGRCVAFFLCLGLQASFGVIWLIKRLRWVDVVWGYEAGMGVSLGLSWPARNLQMTPGSFGFQWKPVRKPNPKAYFPGIFNPHWITNPIIIWFGIWKSRTARAKISQLTPSDHYRNSLTKSKRSDTAVQPENESEND